MYQVHISIKRVGVHFHNYTVGHKKHTKNVLP